MTDDKIRDKVEELIKMLARAMHVSIMYGLDHKLTKESVKAFHGLLVKVLAERPEITIGVIGDEIAFEKNPFYETSEKITGFIDHLKEIDAKKISFYAGAQESEIKEFIRMLTDSSVSGEDKESLMRYFKEAGIRNIAVGDIGYRDGKGDDADGKEEKGIGEISREIQDGIEFLEEAFEGIKGNQPLNIDTARHLVNGMISDMVKNKNMMLLLTSTRSHDENMFVHGVNVAVFTLVQAEALGLEQKYLNEIGTAALLHDVGRLASPSADGAVTDKEEEEMTGQEKKRRAIENVKGAKILLEIRDISILAALVAFEHDLSCDGTGYPERAYGDKPNLASMMISIADYYDMLRAKETYYEEGGPEKVYEKMMKLSGKKFHPDLLNNFFSIVGVYPPGTLVELNTGETALVVQESALDMKRPQVEVLYDEKGNKYDEPRIVNLLEKDNKGDFKWEIVKALSPAEKFKIPEKYTK